MQDKNHMACYLMQVGELFQIIARVTADFVSGANMDKVMIEVRPKILKQCNWIRYSAEMYFGVKATVGMSPPNLSKYFTKFETDFLFDLAGNLIRVASVEIDQFLQREEAQNNMNVVECNLQAIEMLAKGADNE